MASRTRIREGMTLEEFLELPEDQPALEYIDGRIEAKVFPRFKHSLITLRLLERLNRWAGPGHLGLALPERRCTFAGRSIIPDIVFLLDEHIEDDASGEPIDQVWRPPDIHVEIICPDQGMKESRGKIEHSTAHGCPLGWLIHPDNKSVDVFRPGQPASRMSPEGILEGEPILPEFRLPVAEVFGWLRHRYGRRGPGNEGR
jgi:Uma2 family endonuclease